MLAAGFADATNLLFCHLLSRDSVPESEKMVYFFCYHPLNCQKRIENKIGPISYVGKGALNGYVLTAENRGDGLISLNLTKDLPSSKVSGKIYEISLKKLIALARMGTIPESQGTAKLSYCYRPGHIPVYFFNQDTLLMGVRCRL